MEQQQYDRRDMIADAITVVESRGRIESGPHLMTVSGAEIKVRDTRTSLLVAYSSTRADYEQSLAEFVSDYIL